MILRNCRIVNINQLLFVVCKQCNGKVIKLGGNRAVVQQRRLPFLELPEFIQRQQVLLELKEQTQRADLNFYCVKCNTHVHCHRTFFVKLNVYCGSQQELKDLYMFDDSACQFFGCNAESFVELSRYNKNLAQHVEDYLTERTWNISLQYRKKKPSDKIIGMEPVLTETPQEPLIPYLAKKNIPSCSTQSSSLVLDSSLASWF